MPSAAYDLRLVGYTPLGNRIGIIPDMGITVTTSAAGPTLNATVSSVVYGTLPTSLEVAVEWWHASTKTWTESRDCRFAITQQAYDDRDLTGTTTLTGIGVGAYLMAANALAGVEPYVNTTGTSEAAATSTTVSVSGSTFTWASHVFGTGDRIHISSKGSASKNLKAGTYFVRNPTTNTFQISVTATGAIKGSLGTASNIHAERVVTRIVFSGSHQFTKSSQVLTVGGSALGLSDGTAYYVVNPTTATIQLSSSPGGTPITLSAASTNVTQVYRNLDGQRLFTNAHPGTVLSAAFNEAKTRGWGIGPTDQVTHGWTTSVDSAGNAWTSMADDPTTPGISVGFQPGTPMTSILQFMLDNQYAEWYASGRIINVVNYGYGTDHTVGSAPKRIGTEASQLPVTVDLTNMRNSVIVRGSGPILREKDGTTGAWGRLETYVTASGITTKTSADKQALTDIAANGTPQIGYSVTEMAQEAAYLPGVHFSRGDWVAVQLAGTGWTRLRVIGWTLAKAANGAITVTNILQYQKQHLVAKALKATQGSSAGLSDSGTSTSPMLDADNRKPSAPVIASVTCQGVFASDDSSASTATVVWNGVSADINGTDITSVNYQVWLRAEAADVGTIVGETAGLTLTIPALPSGRTFAVSVRAFSDQGTWGEFSDEFEFVTVYDTTVPNPPTAPTVTGRLGQARVAWDGALVDPALGNVAASDATQQGFAYVYVGYSTTSGGTYTQIGTNMGNAGAVSISALAIGTTYWFGLFAVNSVGTVSAMSAPTSYTIVGVTGPDLVANSVTANSILAGAITADKLDVGTVPQGNPINRVPQPPFVTSYWGLVVSGATQGFSFFQATSSATGLTLAAGGASGLRQSLTQAKVPAPPSMVINLAIGLTSTASVTVYVRTWDSTGHDNGAVAVPATGPYTLPATAQTYEVFVNNTNTGGVATTITSAQVFEVIGTAATGQAAQLSPAGLRLFDTNGVLAMDLTTASQQFINIYDNTGAEPAAVAQVDQFGNAVFAEVSGAGFDLNGLPFTNEASGTTLSQSTPNNSSFGNLPLLDRLARGPVYDCTWNTLNGTTVTTQYLRIAQDQFTLEDGRSYQFVIQDGGLMISTANASGVNVYVELELGTVPNTSVTSGTVVQRAVVFNTERGYYAMPPVVYSASTAVSTIDTVNRLLPAGVPIYWQMNTNLSATPTSSYAFAEFGNSRGLTVIDIGSSALVRPLTTSDALVNATDRTTSGASSGSTTGGTTATSTTLTFTASWSATYNSGGASKVTGTGQYTNGAAMYQGNGASAMGSQFGFSSTDLAKLSGKTITAVSLYMKNTYMGYSGQSALLGTHSATAATSTIGNARGANPWSAAWSSGQGKWVTVPSGAIWTGLTNGGVRGFQLGVSSSNSAYGYFAGATQSSPPQLKITFH